ncbi:MAG: hypothetical protein ACFE9S_04285 [Candidatus Hermodarchaeota archaeon]
MTLTSDTHSTGHYNKEQFQRILMVINQIVDYLGKFENHYDRKFNFSKLVKLLKIPQSQTDDIIYLLLNFQEKFEKVFIKYRLRKYLANNQVYLVTERKYEHEKIEAPAMIQISSSHIELLNDIIYVFKHVKRGNGFDILKNGSELLTKVRELRETHPYLFETKSNGVVYPSELGLKLGEIIIAYNKSNKKIQSINIGNHKFMVNKDR